MSNVSPSYVFTSASDPITASKLNLLGTPSVVIGANEVVTAMIADNSVTVAKLAQGTGGGFIGRRAATLGNMEFVTLSDGGVTWPTTGIAISAGATTEIDLGSSNSRRFRLQYDGSSVASIAIPQGESNLGGSTGPMDIVSGSWTWKMGDGATGSTQVFSIARQGSGGTTTADILIGIQSALATNATTGFPYIPSCAGTPTGAAYGTHGALCPMVVDTTAGKLWLGYNGAWHFVTLT